jgi:hypothetical protein
MAPAPAPAHPRLMPCADRTTAAAADSTAVFPQYAEPVPEAINSKTGPSASAAHAARVRACARVRVADTAALLHGCALHRSGQVTHAADALVARARAARDARGRLAARGRAGGARRGTQVLQHICGVRCLRQHDCQAPQGPPLRHRHPRRALCRRRRRRRRRRPGGTFVVDDSHLVAQARSASRSRSAFRPATASRRSARCCPTDTPWWGASRALTCSDAARRRLDWASATTSASRSWRVWPRLTRSVCSCCTRAPST